MLNNSIYCNLDKNAFYSELLLEINHPSNKEKVFLLFEGFDDICFFKKFLSDSCIVFESYGGKKQIADVLNDSTFNKDNIIGIVDRDYTVINHERLFVSDECNLEMMVISNDDVYNSVVQSLTRKIKDYASTRTDILNLLLPMSVIRKRNNDMDFGIDLSSVDIKQIVRNTNCEFNDYITYIKSNDFLLILILTNRFICGNIQTSS